MRLSLAQRLGQMLRGVSSREVSAALRLAEENDMDISPVQVESHLRAGGDAVAVVRGLVRAKEHGIALDWTTAMSIDLCRGNTGKGLEEVVEACMPLKEHRFDTFSSDDPESLVGFARDGSAVKATCTLRYRLTPEHVFGQSIDQLQERLAVRVAVLMNRAADASDLQMKRSEHERVLLSMSAEAGVEGVSLDYEPV